MADLATQFIGRSSASINTPSSTRQYEAAWGVLANTGRYEAHDIIMISGSGPWRGVTELEINDTFQQHYTRLIDLAIAACVRGFVVGSAPGCDLLTHSYLKMQGYEAIKGPGFYKFK